MSFRKKPNEGYVSKNNFINSLFGSQSPAGTGKAPPHQQTAKKRKQAPSVAEADDSKPKRRKVAAPEPTTISNLPFEMLEEIFKHLWLHQLPAVAQVCRLFRAATASPCVRWSRLTISTRTESKIDKKFSSANANAGKYTQDLLIRWSKRKQQSAAIPLSLLRRMPNLKTLSIAANTWNEIYSVLLKPMIDEDVDIPNLESLSIRSRLSGNILSASSEDVSELARFLKGFSTQIRTLSLSNLIFTDFEAIRMMTSLKNLESVGLRIDIADACQDVGLVLSSCTKLTSLDLKIIQGDWSIALKGLEQHEEQSAAFANFSVRLGEFMDSSKITKNPFLSWKHDWMSGKPAEAFKFLEHCAGGSLNRLILPGPDEACTSEVLQQITTNFLNLEDVRLDNWNFSSVLPQSIGEIGRLSRLRALVLVGAAGLEPDDWRPIKLPLLEKFHIIAAKRLRAEFFEDFDERFAALRDLSLALSAVKNFGAQVLPFLKKLKQLSSINFIGTSIEQPTIAQYIISTGRRLKSVVLGPGGPALLEADLDAIGHYCLDLERLSICLSEGVLLQPVLTVNKRCKALQSYTVYPRRKFNQFSLDTLQKAGVKCIEDSDL